MTDSGDPPGGDSIDRFTDLMRKLIRVPKEEVLKREREYKAKRRRQRSRVAPRRKAG
jgi:hypothetical protein